LERPEEMDHEWARFRMSIDSWPICVQRTASFLVLSAQRICAEDGGPLTDNDFFYL